MNEEKQRFVEIKVNEISLVDNPANEVEFLVTKNMEDSMSEEKVTEEKTEKVEKTEIVSVDSSGKNETLQNVASMVEEIAKSIGVTTTEKSEEKLVEKSEEKPVEKIKETSQCCVTPNETNNEISTTLKTVASMVSDITKAIKTQQEKPEEKPVEKTKSEITLSQVEALKAAVEAFKKALSDMTTIPVGVSPSTNAPKVTSHSNVSSIQKTSDQIEKLNETVVKSMQQLSDRIEKIEKTQNPSTALSAEQTDSQKVKKSLWEGIL